MFLQQQKLKFKTILFDKFFYYVYINEKNNDNKLIRIMNSNGCHKTIKFLKTLKMKFQTDINKSNNNLAPPEFYGLRYSTFSKILFMFAIICLKSY